jgi:hypothetical protein
VYLLNTTTQSSFCQSQGPYSAVGVNTAVHVLLPTRGSEFLAHLPMHSHDRLQMANWRCGAQTPCPSWRARGKAAEAASFAAEWWRCSKPEPCTLWTVKCEGCWELRLNPCVGGVWCDVIWPLAACNVWRLLLFFLPITADTQFPN